MSRDKYLTEFGSYLLILPQERKTKILDFYSEYTARLEADGEDLIAKLGTPKELAENLLDLELNQGSSANYEFPKKNRKKHSFKPFIITLIILCSLVAVVITGFFIFVKISGRTIYWDKTQKHLVLGDSATHYTLEKTKIDSFSSIDIDVQYANVNFVAADDYYIEYDITADSSEPYFIHNDTLTFNDSSRTYFHINIGLNHNTNDKHKEYVTIYYPEGADFKMLKADLDMGSIEITGANIKELDLDLDMGSLAIDNCNIKSISSSLDMGSITIMDCIINTADFDLDMGNLDITDTAIYDGMEADLDMGSADLKLMSKGQNREAIDYGFDLSCDMGDVSLNSDDKGRDYHQKGVSKIEISCDMGSISIYTD
ncbi:MAG: DUF4097 family beta strand repeat-containing protein [Lachnospiraceae bacterium]|nr:DUF4097 family beta strand repeat-containing protein [Lachnospiraceae bacterium]